MQDSQTYLYRPDARPRVESMRRNSLSLGLLSGSVCLIFAIVYTALSIGIVLGLSSTGFAGLGYAVVSVLVTLYGTAFSALVVMNILIRMADITVSEAGIDLHLIDERHKFIAWEQVRDAAFRSVPYTIYWRQDAPTGPDTRPLNFRLAGVFDPRWNRRQPRTAYALRVDGLPIYYRLVGLALRMGVTGVMMVTPDHDRYEELCEKIRTYVRDQHNRC